MRSQRLWAAMGHIDDSFIDEDAEELSDEKPDSPKRSAPLARGLKLAAPLAACLIIAAVMLGLSNWIVPPDSPVDVPRSQAPGQSAAPPSLTPAEPPPEYAWSMNVDIYAFHDGWFYFCCPDDREPGGEGFYRMRPDGSGKTKILDAAEIAHRDSVQFDSDREWLYYTNAADHFTLYKIRLDGTEKSQLNDDAFSHLQIVADGWIYYFRRASDDERNYRIRTDGTENEAIYPTAMWIVSVEDGWMYVQEYEDIDNDGVLDENDKLCLYTMRTDGTDMTRMAADVQTAGIRDGWVYYQSPLRAQGYQLHRMRLDGTGKTRLDDYSLYGETVFFSDGWIYFKISAGNGAGVRSLRVDGTDRRDVPLEDLYYIIAVEDGWIYYQSESEIVPADEGAYEREIQGGIYRIRPDGSDRQEIVF